MAALALENTLRRLAKTFVDSADRLAACHDDVDTESMLKGAESTVSGAVYEIREAINSLRSINRLPPEVLARVFSLVPERGGATSFEHWKFWPYRFRNATHYGLPIFVCRYWCTVALDTPALWEDVCILDKQLSNYNGVHRRFPHLPLNLFIERHDGPWRDRAIDLLRTLNPRIRLLHIRMPEPDYENYDEEFWRELPNIICSLPAQNLQHCSLELEGDWPLESFNVLFSGHGANLRSLLLSEIPFLPSNSFPALRCLVLLCRHVNWDMADLLTFLSRQPSLERCHLGFYHDIRTRDLPSICLNALRTLSIDTRGHVLVDMIQALYTHVSLPNIVHRAVNLCSANLFPAFESFLISPLGASYTQFMIRSGDHVKEELVFGRGNPSQTLSFRYLRQVLAHPEDIMAVPSTSPFFSAVQECWILDFRNGTGVGNWFPYLPFLRNLRAIVFGVEAYRLDKQITHTLAHIPDAPAPCRLLETLCLCIHDKDPYWDQRFERLSHIPAKLSAMLRSRREAGCPIRQVIVGFTGKADSEVDAQLREMDGLVDELVWFWEVGVDLDWLGRVPSLLLPSSPIHVGWANMKMGWAYED